MIKLYKQCGVALGCAALLFLHFYRLGEVPGLHFDEAWAMNYAWRIAHERGFWPVTAMSAYTAPWAHYWAALWMKLLGPSVLVFRGSQVTLALAGLVALCFALPRHLRAAFPWAVLLVPGLVLNHRFAIELNGFHVLCFGALCWGIRARWYGAACAAALAGTTAHILFYGVALGVMGTVWLEGIAIPRRARVAAAVYFALMAAFFLRVLFMIPEKGKAGALVISAVALLAALFLQAERWRIWRSGVWAWLVPLASLVFVFNCLFFAQGFWDADLATGYALSVIPGERTLFWIGAVGLAIAMARAFLASPRWAVRGFFLITLVIGVLMLKPAPRYFEIPLLALASLLCWDFWSWLYLIEWPISRRLHLLTALSGLLAINLGLSLSHYILIPPVDSPLHFLAFKDSSRDFLDKQGLVRFLGGSGCEPGDIHTDDPRLKEELNALALGDWPVEHLGPCKWNFVARRSDPGAQGEPWREFVLRRKN